MAFHTSCGWLVVMVGLVLECTFVGAAMRTHMSFAIMSALAASSCGSGTSEDDAEDEAACVDVFERRAALA